MKYSSIRLLSESSTLFLSSLFLFYFTRFSVVRIPDLNHKEARKRTLARSHIHRRFRVLMDSIQWIGNCFVQCQCGQKRAACNSDTRHHPASRASPPGSEQELWDAASTTSRHSRCQVQCTSVCLLGYLRFNPFMVYFYPLRLMNREVAQVSGTV